jgi:hypothetical protein
MHITYFTRKIPLLTGEKSSSKKCSFKHREHLRIFEKKPLLSEGKSVYDAGALKGYKDQARSPC